MATGELVELGAAPAAWPSAPRAPRVLRIAHHGVVSAWRQRERELIALGADVTLLSARVWNEGGSDVAFRAGGDRFVRAAATIGQHVSVFLFAPGPLWRLAGEDWDLVDLHEEPNALVTLQTLAMLRLRGRRPPFVLYSAQNLEKRFPPPFRWIERYALTHATGAYVCNDEAAVILRAKGLRGPARVIGLGVDLDRFRPATRSGPATPPVVGYVGRLADHKGLSVLLDAMAGTDWRLEVAGDGPRAGALRDRAQQLGLADRVRFAGHVDGDQLPEFYRRLDVVVIPSLPTPGWLEQFGRVAVEAMAAGVPVVASRSGALPDVVQDAGLLVPPGDPDALRSAVTDALTPACWTRLRRAGLERCRRYTWSAVAAAQLDLYREALGRAGASAPLRPDEPSAQEPPEVVVVAYGPPDAISPTLAALEGRLPVTLVDNSSLPQTRALAEAHGAHYVDAGGNIGFAAGVNTALRSLRERGRDASDVLLLNPDAVISADGVLALQRALHASRTHACVAPAQHHPETHAPERVVWPFPSPAAAWLGAVGAGRLDRRLGFAIGSILLLRRAALRDVGELDDGFFLYAEETDWQRRATRRGWTVGFVPSVVGTHVGAGTGGSTDRRLRLFHGSLVRYMGKHHGRLGAWSFRAAMLAGSSVRAVVGRGETRAAARARTRLYLRPSALRS